MLTVLATEDIRQGDLVILTTTGAHLLRGPSDITADNVVAKAADPMTRGSHGKIVFLDTKRYPQGSASLGPYRPT
jgi:hypothetical protein